MFFPQPNVNCPPVRWGLLHFLLVIFLLPVASSAQVNAYASVTGINSNTLTLSNVNLTYGNFAVGEQVIVIQMQGASLAGTSNNSSYGTLSSLNSAGLFELATINSINTSMGFMTLTSALNNNYSVASNVQVVSFPRLGTVGYVVSNTISALPWNGSIGGIVAFQVQGNLVMLNPITANGAGFRGGAKAGSDGSNCQGNMWIANSGDPRYADKGEGIILTPTSARSGKAKILNGGGGGIVHNGGGGGGSNFTSGGAGYYGFDGNGCSASVNAGGQGGISLSSGITRVFAGGGGGGGQENNGFGTSGGDGGGLIFIRCDTIVVPTIGVARSITADGEAGPNTGGHDGAGGGGGGGSILLDVKGVRVPLNSTLNISANGGNGGSVMHPDLHGSGGGGGQGTILISVPSPFVRTNVQTLNGVGGLANTSPGAPRAGNGSGVNNVGVKWQSGTLLLLPVTLSEFTVKEDAEGSAVLNWVTKTEINNRVFEVYHMVDDLNWKKVGEVPGAGNSHEERQYQFTHAYPVRNKINYYKLLQRDEDDKVSYSDVVFLELSSQNIALRMYPNPVSSYVTCESDEEPVKGNIYVTNSRGINVPAPIVRENDLKFTVDLTGEAAGLYVIRAENIQVRIIKY